MEKNILQHWVLKHTGKKIYFTGSLYFLPEKKILFFMFLILDKKYLPEKSIFLPDV